MLGRGPCLALLSLPLLAGLCGFALSCLVLSGLVWSGLVLSCLVLSCLFSSCFALLPALYYLALPCFAIPLALPCLVKLLISACVRFALSGLALLYLAFCLALSCLVLPCSAVSLALPVLSGPIDAPGDDGGSR